MLPSYYFCLRQHFVPRIEESLPMKYVSSVRQSHDKKEGENRKVSRFHCKYHSQEGDQTRLRGQQQLQGLDDENASVSYILVVDSVHEYNNCNFVGSKHCFL